MLIGFTGCKGAGKDSAAKFLIDELDFIKIAFADKLKEAVANLIGIGVPEVDRWKEMNVNVSFAGGHMTFRTFLQRFGTEMGRNTFGQDFWLELWHDVYKVHSRDGDNVVVTDVRFPNEAKEIHWWQGTVVEIVRDGYEPDGHASEEPLDRKLIDAQIINNGTLDDLRVSVYDLYKELQRG